MTGTLKVTAKGQVTLRKEVLAHLGVSPGDRIVVDFLPSGRIEARAARPPESIDAFIGCLETNGSRPPTIEEINEIAAAGWAGSR
jgi:bifunctional DNA-binding transcriptional regulator/antitoxin component of YhaV-PrlF toxin-antitoxin module